MKWCSRLQWDNTEESHQKYYPSLTSNDHKNNFMIKLPLWYSAEPRLELVKLIESKRYLHMADTSFAYHCVAANWIFCGRLSAAAFGHPSLLFAFCKDWVYLRRCANTNTAYDVTQRFPNHSPHHRLAFETSPWCQILECHDRISDLCRCFYKVCHKRSL